VGAKIEFLDKLQISVAINMIASPLSCTSIQWLISKSTGECRTGIWLQFPCVRRI